MKIILCGAFAASLVASAFADVAFSSFGPGGSFNPNTGLGIGGPPVQSGAFQFTSSSTGILASLEFAALTVRNGDVSVHLLADNSNERGSEIASWPATLNTDAAMVKTLTNSLSSVVLTAGSRYWLEIRPVSSNVSAAWLDNDQGAVSLAYYQSNDGSDYRLLPTATFRVTTSVVPEPTSMAVLGLGALTLVRKRRKKA